MRVRRSGALALAAGVSGITAAIALAAAPGPGVPQSERVQDGWTAQLVRSAERTCTSADGEPVRESVELFQASDASNTSSEPRLDGRIDFYVHSVVFHGRDVRGLIDGNAHWFSGDSGPQTAYAKIAGFVAELGIEAVAGGRSTDDGFVVRQDPRPRAKLFAPFQSLHNLTLDGQLIHFDGAFGAPKLLTEFDGLIQAFNCSGEYQDVPVAPPAGAQAQGDGATKAGASRKGKAAGLGLGLTTAELVKATKLTLTEQQVLATRKPPVPLVASPKAGVAKASATRTARRRPLR